MSRSNHYTMPGSKPHIFRRDGRWSCRFTGRLTMDDLVALYDFCTHLNVWEKDRVDTK